jgi:DeoR family transcriptional regulator, suf operon transcriptional repressor
MPSMISGRSTRMEVLELLRRKKAASAESISAELGITANAVRQHLTNLERERADSVFPKRYGQLATMVLTEIQEMAGPGALDEIFRRVAMRHATAVAPDLEGLDFDDRLRHLVAWIRRAGTLADAEETEDGVRVSIHNCPFRATALKFPQVCTITPQLLTNLLDASVSQGHSIHRGDPHCSFVVQRPAPAEPE